MFKMTREEFMSYQDMMYIVDGVPDNIDEKLIEQWMTEQGSGKWYGSSKTFIFTEESDQRAFVIFLGLDLLNSVVYSEK